MLLNSSSYTQQCCSNAQTFPNVATSHYSPPVEWCRDPQGGCVTSLILSFIQSMDSSLGWLLLAVRCRYGCMQSHAHGLQAVMLQKRQAGIDVCVCVSCERERVYKRVFFFFFFCIAGVSVVFCLLVVAPGVQSEQGTDGQWLCDAVYWLSDSDAEAAPCCSGNMDQLCSVTKCIDSVWSFTHEQTASLDIKACI